MHAASSKLPAGSSAEPPIRTTTFGAPTAGSATTPPPPQTLRAWPGPASRRTMSLRPIFLIGPPVRNDTSGNGLDRKRLQEIAQWGVNEILRSCGFLKTDAADKADVAVSTDAMVSNQYWGEVVYCTEPNKRPSGWVGTAPECVLQSSVHGDGAPAPAFLGGGDAWRRPLALRRERGGGSWR